MDNYAEYLDEGTNRLLEVLSQMDMDKETTEAIVNAYTEELYKGVCNAEKMPDYEPLINGMVLTYTDAQLTKALSSQTVSSEVADRAIYLYDKLESLLNLFREKGWQLPDITNIDTQKIQRRIDDIKQSIAEKDNLYIRILDGDKHIDDAVTSQVTSESDYQSLIMLCRNQQQLIDECGTRGWPVPSVKYSEPRTLVNMYSHYQQMIKLDELLASQIGELTTSKHYNEFFANCEKQKRNVEICNNNAWGIPLLMTGDPGVLLDKVTHEKRKKDIAKSIKRALIIAVAVAVLSIVVVIICVVKDRLSKVQIPVDTSYATGMEYVKLKEIFEKAGFENIHVVADDTGWEESGTVKTVLVDGKETFDKDAYFEPDVIVEIHYRSLERVEISQYLNDWQNRDYEDVKTLFLNNKFTSITLNAIDTLEKEQDKKVCGLTLNNQAYTNGRCYLPLNAPIEISYYVLKASVRCNNAQYMGQDYRNVVDSLKDDGFTNVQTEEVKSGWAKGNTVIEVMINNSSSFDVGQTFDPGVKTVVKYSSNDRVEVTNLIKDWQTTNYSTVQKALTTAGFTNVTVVAKDTSELSHNLVIAELTFNGEVYTEGECFLQKSAPIKIEYYNLKITPGKAAKDYVSNTVGYYSTVVSELKALGFTNIKVYRKNDLINGLITKEGAVDSISIAGNNSFTAPDSFYYDDEIEIFVHTFKGKGCEDIKLIAD